MMRTAVRMVVFAALVIIPPMIGWVVRGCVDACRSEESR